MGPLQASAHSERAGRAMNGGMRLNHLNLSVTDVPACVAMFETYFGLRRADMPVNEHMAFLRGEDGFLLSMFRAREVSYPRSFHIGFLQDTPEEVHAIHARLSAGGFQVPPLHEDHGRLTFYFDAPGGFVVEVEAFLPKA